MNKAESLAFAERYPMDLLDLESVTDEMYIAALNSMPDLMMWLQDLSISEEVKLAGIQLKPFSIQFVTNPSEELQMAAILINPEAIEVIDNPTERVKLYAKAMTPFEKRKN